LNANTVVSFRRALACFAGAAFCPLAAGGQQVPQAFEPPAGEQLVLQVHAKGDQIYSCKAGEGGQWAWVLEAPEAQLFDKDGKVFGKHFAGPSWQAGDGSRIVAKAAANAPSPDPDSIPWLLLAVTSHRGEGALAKVASVQRLNTKGGRAPASGCDSGHAGQKLRAAYSADYLFFARK
jgi:hypothetical protein